MKNLFISFALLAAFLPVAAAAESVAKVAPKQVHLKLSNENVDVAEVSLKPGEMLPTHTHPNHVVYVLDPGKLEVTFATGKKEIIEGKAGEALWAGTEGPHTTKNIGTTAIRFVLVELKGKA